MPARAASSLYYVSVPALTLALCACSGAASSPLLEPGLPPDAAAAPASDAASSDGGSQHDAHDTRDAAAGIHCGDTACDPVGQVCCRQSDAGATPVDKCTAIGACNQLAIPCASAADCAASGRGGEVCCLTAGAGSVAGNVQCTAPGACAGSSLCDRSAATPCGNGAQCVASVQTLPGYSYCK
jgi:hypothetical protein